MGKISELVKRVQALPPEIFNWIRDESFRFSESTCDIDSNYKPPLPLQVNRASREAFARSYYSETTFKFEDYRECYKWLVALPESHRRLLAKIRLTWVVSEEVCRRLHARRYEASGETAEVLTEWKNFWDSILRLGFVIQRRDSKNLPGAVEFTLGLTHKVYKDFK